MKKNKEEKSTNTEDVTAFLAGLKHPLKNEIDEIRKIVLSSNKGLAEIIKWNAPSFCHKGEDRITMRIHPPKQIQLIFHRGTKVQKIPKDKLINDASGILAWKTNDRAVATFTSMGDIKLKTSSLVEIINKWLKATK